jgi:hypothetical protein
MVDYLAQPSLSPDSAQLDLVTHDSTFPDRPPRHFFHSGSRIDPLTRNREGLVAEP